MYTYFNLTRIPYTYRWIRVRDGSGMKHDMFQCIGY